MIELAFNNLEKYYGASKVLNNINFDIQSGEKVGIIGRNGCGKTTLFKVICGIEDYHKGMMTIRKGALIGYLEQVPEYSKDTKVIDILNTAFSNIIDISQEMKALELQMAQLTGIELEKVLKKYGMLQVSFEHNGGYHMEEKLNKICIGLKIDDNMKARNFNTLSGGEKTIILLGRILLINPDILLLDEPSNHLDMDSIEWLDSFLKEYSGTVLIISHDRYFLDSVVSKIIEIEDGESELFLGNYSYYMEEKERRQLAEFEVYENQQKKIKAMENTIKKLRDWGQRGDNVKFFRRAASMQKRLDKINKIDKPKLESSKIQLNFSSTDRSGKDVLLIKNLFKSFNSNSIIEALDFHIRYGERIGLLGKNGCGKSTLLKIITQDYIHDKGELSIGASVKIGYLSQNIAFEKEDTTILEAFRNEFAISEGEARKILSKFLFYGERVFKKIENLSGGEKSRLKLCQLMHQNINFLILDEPTNHLDIESREMLEEALIDFKGTILFVSHDRYFINKVAKRIVELQNKKLINYNGNYNYYKEKRLELTPIPENIQNENKTKVKNKYSKSPSNNILSKEKLQNKLEKQINCIEEDIAALNNDMEKYSDDYCKLKELYNIKEIKQRELDNLLAEWIQIS